MIAVDKGVYFGGCDRDFYRTVDYRVRIGGYRQGNGLRSFFNMGKGKVCVSSYPRYTSFDFGHLHHRLSRSCRCKVSTPSSGSNGRYLKENIGQARFKKNWITLIPDILAVVALSACSPPNFLKGFNRH